MQVHEGGRPSTVTVTRMWSVGRDDTGVNMSDNPREIAPDVIFLRTMMVNVYLIRAGSSWVLVDAGLRGYANTIRRAAQRNNSAWYSCSKSVPLSGSGAGCCAINSRKEVPPPPLF